MSDSPTPEHRIRLARAWTQRIALLPPRRVDLPTVWTEADARQPFELVRQFQWPPLDLGTQVVDLELIDVPGLRVVCHSGRKLVPGRAEPGLPIRVNLGVQAGGRDQLVLAVNLTGVELGQPWGSIALVIRDRRG